MTYSIGEFSRLTGLGIHTLRYYESEGLLSPERDISNRRRYSDGDVTWAEFILRLKATGMPIKDIRRYSELRATGDGTLTERLDMLAQHREALSEKISQLQEHRDRLDEKIEFYREKIIRQE